MSLIRWACGFPTSSIGWSSRGWRTSAVRPLSRRRICCFAWIACCLELGDRISWRCARRLKHSEWRFRWNLDGLSEKSKKSRDVKRNSWYIYNQLQSFFCLDSIAILVDGDVWIMMGSMKKAADAVIFCCRMDPISHIYGMIYPLVI
jgi:hypothetical protein